MLQKTLKIVPPPLALLRSPDLPPMVHCTSCDAYNLTEDCFSKGTRDLKRVTVDTNDFPRLTGSRREHGLDGLDGLLDLFVGHRLDAPASTFVSQGTSNASILRYTPGWLRATFSIAFLP
jgi:hypothetical protein